MARAKAILQSEYPYTVTARCINKEWFNIPMDQVWKIFCEQLENVHQSQGWQIHSFVLMSNHFHLLVSTPQANISQCMLMFMTRSSKALTKAGNRVNETFAGRHYKCILDEYNYFLNAYKYNYRNPVAAGICDRVEDYPYSTLKMKLEKSKKTTLLEDTLLSEDPAGILQWLNEKPDRLMLEAARTAFRRPYFKSKKMKNSDRPVIGVNDVL